MCGEYVRQFLLLEALLMSWKILLKEVRHQQDDSWLSYFSGLWGSLEHATWLAQRCQAMRFSSGAATETLAWIRELRQQFTLRSLIISEWRVTAEIFERRRYSALEHGDN